MISRTERKPAFSIRTEISVSTIGTTVPIHDYITKMQCSDASDVHRSVPPSASTGTRREIQTCNVFTRSDRFNP